MTRFFSLPTPRLFAHRGDNVRWPENTLPAFQAAVDRGVFYLELDVWLSRDERVVVHHDRNTARTCGKKWKIPRLRFEDIRKLDPGRGFINYQGERPFQGQGIRILALEEVLDAFPQVFFTVEIKQDSQRLRQWILEILRSRQCLDRVLLASHRDRVIRGLRRMEPGLPTNFGYKEAKELIQRAWNGNLSGYKPPGDALQIPPASRGKNLVTSDVVRAAHSLGVEVHVWTVNDAEYARSLLHIGVDGIMSDDAEMLRDLEEESQNVAT